MCKPLIIKGIIAFFCSGVFTILLFPFFIKRMQNKTAPIRDFFTENHVKEKQKTPSLGGLLMLLIYISGILICCNLQNQFTLIIIFSSLAFGFLGFIDDYMKISKNAYFTIKTSNKLKIQITLSAIFATWTTIAQNLGTDTHILIIPFIKLFVLKIGVFYYLLKIFVITGTINGVNLTDGLDGLVSVPSIFTLTLFAIIAFIFGVDTSLLKSNLGVNIQNREIYQDVFLFCVILIGVIVGFLKHNYKPAKIFMGDTGSIFIGANIAIISLMLKQEFLLFVCGMIFVIETITSLIQIYCIRTGKRRPFKMCPIHHHFEFYGWSEKKIIFLFWAFSFLFFAISLLIFIKSYTNI